MHDEKFWQRIAVLGAAGKMGRGISLLLLQEIAFLPIAKIVFQDANSQALIGLKQYLREHLTKFAEKQINSLRPHYATRGDLIDNSDMIDVFVHEALDKARFVTTSQECAGAALIFEAIVEDVQAKADLFRQVASTADPQAFYFTNTSSIPIHVLQEKSHLRGHLIGFHFYNPPAVQKLLEIILPEATAPLLREQALGIVKRLKKIAVFSKDVAGFIGNGHFIREIASSCNKVRELSQSMPMCEAIFLINRLYQDFLLRPMGIFQLIDYVGIDVCQRIEAIMTTYLPGNSFNDQLIEGMVNAGVLGGQHSDGSQKNGFFQYDKGKPVAIYNLQTRAYMPCTGQPWEMVSGKLGPLPPEHQPWKVLSRDPQKMEKLENYFCKLAEMRSLGAEMAWTQLEQSKKIAHQLVEREVAHSIEDVNTVLKEGFFHLYGVDVPFQAREAARPK